MTITTGSSLPSDALIVSHQTDASHSFVNPVTGTHQPPRVLRAFDKPQFNWLPGHRGVDLAAEINSPVFAAEDATVLFAGVVAGVPTVSLEHSGGLRTTYQPVFAHVHQGDQIHQGDVIGILAPPHSRFPGLQWGAKYGSDDYINPLSLLEKPMIRLKPVPDNGT